MKKLLKFKSKKFLVSVIFMVFVMLINSISVMAVQLEISAHSPESVNIGNSFDIVFSADRDTNIKAIRLKAGYNSNYILFKGINKIQPGEINYNAQSNKVDIIILFDSTLKSGDIFKLQLTAKTGNKSSKQNISFEVLEAVDKDLKDVSVNITAGADIEIIKKDDQSSKKETDSSSKNSTTVSKNSGTSASSKSNRTSSANASYKTNTSSKSNSSRVYSNVSKNEYSGAVDNASENGEKAEQGIEDEFAESYEDNTTSVSQFQNGRDIGNLNLKDSKSKYVFVGIGGTVSVIGILFAAFRLGQLSRRKPESDKIFPKNDNEDKW